MSDLRVLAVQAEPAEAQFDQQGSGASVVISNVDDQHVRMLVVDGAHRGSPAAVTVNLCAPTDSRRCEKGPRVGVPVSRSSGDEFTAVIPGALMAAVIQFAQSDDKLKGLNGIRVMLSIAVSDADPNSPVYADKILLYTQRGTPPNHNPAMTGATLTQEGVFWKQLAPGAALSVPVGPLYGMRPILAADAREEYDTTDLQGRTVHLKEDPTYSFFTTPGAEFDRDTAYEPVDGVAPPDGLTRVDAFNRGPGTIWIVVRDGRGGESWISFPWSAF